MRRSLLEERLLCCRRAGLRVSAVATTPVGALNAWLAARSAGDTHQGVLLNLLSDHAAEWIIWSADGLQVVPVVSPSPEALAGALVASWESLRADAIEGSSRIWEVGPPEMLSPVREALSGAVGLRVEPFTVTGLLATGSRARPPAAAPSVTATGLALQGLGLARLGVNLLTDVQTQRRAERLRRVAVIASGLFAVVTVALAVRGMAQLHEQRTHLLRSLERQARLQQTLRPEVRALLQAQQELHARSRHVEALIQGSPAVIRLLAQVAEALPERVWLTAVECSKKGASIDGWLEGRARSFQDLTELMDRLKRVDGVAAVKPLATQVVTDPASGKELIAFSVQLERPAR